MLLEAEKQRRLSGVNCHLDERDVLHRFPIHYGVECNSVEVVEELLKWEVAQINAQDIFGLTSLHLALRSKADNREAMVALLLNVQNIDVRLRSVTPSSNERHDLQMSGLLWSTPFLPFRPVEQESSNNLTALHFAARMGSAQIVSSLLQMPGMEVNVQDDRSFIPLDLAIEKGHVEVVELLLEYTSTSDLERKHNCTGNTPLHIATKNGHLEITNLLLEHANKLHFNKENADENGAHLNNEEGHVDEVKGVLEHSESYIKEKNSDGNTPLHLAVEEGHANVVEFLLKYCNPLDLEVENVAGQTPLHLAILGGHDEVVKVWLEQAELNLEVENKDGNTLLHLASLGGHVKVVNIMLEHIPELSLMSKNKDGNSIFHLATKGGHVEVVMVFLENVHGKKLLNMRNNDWNRPLHLAIEEGHVNVVNTLLEIAGNELGLNEKNRDGNTPLHLATEGGHHSVVTKLLELVTTEKSIGLDSKATNNVHKDANKLNLNATNEEENTPLHLAAKEGHVKIVDAMLQFAGELTINANNIRGNTPLHLAAIHGHVDVVKKLVEPELEVDLNNRNRQGQTPLHFATIKCYPDVVKVLCEAQQRLNANLKDGRGKTCLQYAKERHQTCNTKLKKHSNIKNILDKQCEKKLDDIANILMERSDVKEFMDEQYKHRQDFIDAANALLVAGALIAGITFASWLQPPLGYTTYYQFPQSSPETPPSTFESFAALEFHYILRLFWVFNTLSFFFAIATVISGAKVAFPDLDAIFIVETLHSMAKEIQLASSLLVCSVVTVLGSFVCAGFVVLPPIHRDTKNMKVSVTIGLIVCSWTIFKFLVKLVKVMASSLIFRFFSKLKEIVVIIVNKSKREHLEDYDGHNDMEETRGGERGNEDFEDKSLWALLSKCMQGERDEDGVMEEEAPHTWFNTKSGSELLMITPMKLSWQRVKHTMDESREEHVGGIQGVGVIQGNRPAMFHHETLSYYFEITIIDDFDHGDGVAIGFTNENFKKHQLPGWDLNTYGYHSDSGKLYHNSGDIAYSDKMKQFGKNFDTTTFRKGDVVGVGINYLKRNVYFVKNKKLLGRIYYNLEKTLYPTIGFWGKSVTVDVNFPTKSDLDVNHDMQYSNPQPPKRWWLWWK
jgi:ankyrin repeat protein